MWKVYLFGAGKKGKYWIRCLKGFGVLPEGFIDNNKALQGNVYDGVPIYSPDRLKKHVFDYIAVTCKDGEAVFQQLLKLGIPEDKIIFGYHRLRNYLFYFIAKNLIREDGTISNEKINSNQKVLLDLQNGMVLGGVESWSYELAGQLKKKGFEGGYLTIDKMPETSADKTYPAYVLQYQECKGERERLELCIHVIAKNLPCTVICNFPQYIFWSACIAKKLYPDQVRIIAIQHNDDRPYYEAYSLWQEYIDRCIVISARMEKKQLAHGMERDKMMHMEWQISCVKNLKRTWSKEKYPVQIGYAGRVTVTQKRIDLLLEVAKKLRKKDIQFRLNIAGTGDYAETLHNRLQGEELSDYVNMIGYIDRDKISGFWVKQDIMISCSEWEGHSISQSEAMAAGAVPVITDVSGARDDVTDGYNGFIVPIGDMDALIDRVCWLYHNRDELECFGKHAHEAIYKQQEKINQIAFWNKLLRKLWKT